MSSEVRSVSELFAERVESFRMSCRQLLLEKSDLKWFNTRSGGVVWLGFGDHTWVPLDQEGRRIRARLLEEIEQLFALLRVLTRSLATDADRRIKDAEHDIKEVVEQQRGTYLKTTEQAVSKTEVALDDLLSLVADLYDGGEETATFVPDTNALLWNPELEAWEFAGVAKFDLVLLPTVLAELDELKVNYRNQDVREKADSLIRRIKGYRARGSLTAGVPLRSGLSSLQALAIEPRLDDSLPWLDPENRDDRILAAVLETMRSRPRSPVVLITRDLNLQNKAEHAGLPFQEPPDPPQLAKPRKSGSAKR